MSHCLEVFFFFCFFFFAIDKPVKLVSFFINFDFCKVYKRVTLSLEVEELCLS